MSPLPRERRSGPIAMGLFGLLVVAAIALGIVVDDTGHLIVRYEQHRRRGRSPEAVARRMLGELWKPVLTTSLVIVIGDLFLLPALLTHFDRRRESSF